MLGGLRQGNSERRAVASKLAYPDLKNQHRAPQSKGLSLGRTEWKNNIYFSVSHGMSHTAGLLQKVSVSPDMTILRFLRPLNPQSSNTVIWLDSRLTNCRSVAPDNESNGKLVNWLKPRLRVRMFLMALSIALSTDEMSFKAPFTVISAEDLEKSGGSPNIFLASRDFSSLLLTCNSLRLFLFPVRSGSSVSLIRPTFKTSRLGKFPKSPSSTEK